VASYYDAHMAEYRKGEQRKVRYLLLDRDQQRARITVSPQDAEAYYNANLQQFQTPEQVRREPHSAEDRRRQRTKPRSASSRGHPQAGQGARAPTFAALAKKYSEDEGRRQRRRSRLLLEGRMVPEFESAAFSMQPGRSAIS
jgi:peptidyl-prolyl cis-trans isomerase D